MARKPVVERVAARVPSIAMALLAVLVGWKIVVPALRADAFGLATDAAGGRWTQDFAPILTLAKAFWHGTGGYDVASFVRVTEEAVGHPVEHALPFPYWPTMLWVLGPLCLLPTSASFVVWTLVGIACLWAMVRARPSPWLVAACFSPCVAWCLKMGQTSIVTTAALFFLMARDVDGRDERRAGWLDGVVLWALSGKPPLAVTAGVVLLRGGRWRALAVAGTLTVVTTLALTPLLQGDWLARYVALLRHYDLDTADPVYATSLVPALMGNVRALSFVTFGVSDATAVAASSAAWMLALASLLALGGRRALPAEARWGFAVLAYLLLCPHVTGTEDISLMLVLAIVADPRCVTPSRARAAAIGATLVDLFVVPLLARDDSARVPVAVACKCVVVMCVAMLAAAGTSRATADPPPPEREPRRAGGVALRRARELSAKLAFHQSRG